MLSVGLAAGLGVAACGSGGGSATGTTSPSHVASSTSPYAKPITSPTVVINGKSVQVPTEAQGVPVSPSVGSGQQVVLTSSGFLPRTLYAQLHQPIVWTNLTPKTVTLTLGHVGVPPQTLPPGGTFQWVPTVLDFGYRSSTGHFGLVNVGAFSS